MLPRLGQSFIALLSLALALGVACSGDKRVIERPGRPGGAAGEASDLGDQAGAGGAHEGSGDSAASGAPGVAGAGGAPNPPVGGDGAAGRAEAGDGGAAGVAAGGEPAMGGVGGAFDGGTPTVITFDDVLDSVNLPIDYAGVSWNPDWYTYHAIEPYYRPHSGTEFVTNLSAASPLEFTFPKSVRFLGAWFSHYTGTTIQLEAFDDGGVSLGKSAVLTQTLEPQFLSFDVQGVKKVTVGWSGSDFSMDDVTYIP